MLLASAMAATKEGRTLMQTLFRSHGGRGRRRTLAAAVNAYVGPFDARLLDALLVVPRERFVRLADREVAYEDRPLPLDDRGQATISAPHAYLLSFRLAALAAGDALLELGSGSGYGAALASHVVGETGRVRTLEIDDTLAARAKDLLSLYPNVETIHADASLASLADFPKTIVTYAVRALPARWIETLPLGGILVVPVGDPGTTQRLMRFTRSEDAIVPSDHGGVRYVPDRSPVLDH
jgi:protein-L-isoaspartate(D-aspartate) O-methyltransferase